MRPPPTQKYCGEKLCDACARPASVVCPATMELYCKQHAPPTARHSSLAEKRDARAFRDRGHAVSVRLAAVDRCDMDLHGSVTMGPMFEMQTVPRLDGLQTLLIHHTRGSQQNHQQHHHNHDEAVMRMPELHPTVMGPVLMCDGETVWSVLLCNGLSSLRWCVASVFLLF